MYLNKERLIEEIESMARGIVDEFVQDLEWHGRHSVDGMISIGEFAFPESEDQFDYDMIVEDHSESCKAEADYCGEIQYATWSSKSGTSVFLDPFEYDGEVDPYDVLYSLFNEYDFDYGETPENFSRDELLGLHKEISELNENICISREEYDTMIKKCTELISSTAYGVKTASFSNGESIFEPTEAYEGATEAFTPYYNPNEEVV